jgi:hypothetical protein
MSGASNDEIERLVVDRVADVVKGSVRRIDDGSADGLHDYEIDLDDGRTAAVEVTGAVDAAKLNTARAALKYRLDDSGVRLGWDVDLDDWNANRSRLKEQLPAILKEFEDNEIHWCSAADDGRLGSLGINKVRVMDRGISGICLCRVGPGSWIGAVDVVDVVSNHGSREDNIRKLKRASADERHLAVWIGLSSSLAHIALNDLGLPGQDPAVDDIIDTVWALRLDETTSGCDIDVVWRWTRGSGWVYCGRSRAVLND